MSEYTSDPQVSMTLGYLSDESSLCDVIRYEPPKFTERLGLVSVLCFTEDGIERLEVAKA
jgi:hypothetical protein